MNAAQNTSGNNLFVVWKAYRRMLLKQTVKIRQFGIEYRVNI
jgi:hypothetical protein